MGFGEGRWSGSRSNEKRMKKWVKFWEISEFIISLRIPTKFFFFSFSTCPLLCWVNHYIYIMRCFLQYAFSLLLGTKTGASNILCLYCVYRENPCSCLLNLNFQNNNTAHPTNTAHILHSLFLFSINQTKSSYCNEPHSPIPSNFLFSLEFV